MPIIAVETSGYGHCEQLSVFTRSFCEEKNEDVEQPNITFNVFFFN